MDTQRERWRRGRFRRVLFKNLPEGAAFFLSPDRSGHGYRKIKLNLSGHNARRIFANGTCTHFSEGKEVHATESEIRRAREALPSEPVPGTEHEELYDD